VARPVRFGYRETAPATARHPTNEETHISNKIFIGNLSFETSGQELSGLLSEAGQVVRVHVGTDRETGRSRGFAFAEFASESEAADAIRRFDGFDLGGRRLRVNDAEDRPPRPAGVRPAQQPRGLAAPREFTAPPDKYAAADPFAFEQGPAGGGRFFKNKGSRRGLRARKRSLGY